MDGFGMTQFSGRRELPSTLDCTIDQLVLERADGEFKFFSQLLRKLRDDIWDYAILYEKQQGRTFEVHCNIRTE
tara:strand:- start:2111 stop:2332 length:222 start_codon:yes stop_codon:yes gene_type:complete